MMPSRASFPALLLLFVIFVISTIVFLLPRTVEVCFLPFYSTIETFLGECYPTTFPPASPAPKSFGKGIHLDLWTRNGTRNDTAPYLPGILFEDIAHSGDGGIYAELIRNRAFQGSGAKIGPAGPLFPGKVITDAENPMLPFGPVLDGWHPIGDGVKLSLDLLHPLSDALQVALQVDVPVDAVGEVGFSNDGWWGVPATPQVYNASFYAQANGFRWNGTLTRFDVSIRDNTTGEVFVSTSVPLDKMDAPVPWKYNHYSTQLHCNRTAPSTNNIFAITMPAEEARGQTFYFNLVSLFPETFKGRPNGLRPDLAFALDAGDFKFLRFPGGNNLEGYSIQRRWKWWETIGPLVDRPGRVGDWSYFNTDGLGLMEYMYWCEDMDLVPVLGVYAGFSLDVVNWDAGNSTDANELPIAMMQPILQEALDELEFLTGSTKTQWGAKRAEFGHPEPFDVPFVEIGNEDFFSQNYPARANYMYEGLRAQYPNITYIYSAGGIWPEGPMDITLPADTIWDEHIYAPPQIFINHFGQFDNWQNTTNNPDAYASIMEYHAGGGHPSMQAAVAEAVYALGWERNPHTVKLACFAPLIQHRNVWRHTPYLALFDVDPANTVLSASYYQEWLFNRYRGQQTLPVTHEGGTFGPLYWVASIDEVRETSGAKIYLKVVNAGDAYEFLDVKVDAGIEGVNGTRLHAPHPRDKEAHNDVGEEKIVPRSIDDLEIRPKDEAILSTVPPWSVSVLQIGISERRREQASRGSGVQPEDQVVLQ